MFLSARISPEPLDLWPGNYACVIYSSYERFLWKKILENRKKKISKNFSRIFFFFSQFFHSIFCNFLMIFSQFYVRLFNKLNDEFLTSLSAISQFYAMLLRWRMKANFLSRRTFCQSKLLCFLRSSFLWIKFCRTVSSVFLFLPACFGQANNTTQQKTESLTKALRVLAEPRGRGIDVFSVISCTTKSFK